MVAPLAETVAFKLGLELASTALLVGAVRVMVGSLSEGKRENAEAGTSVFAMPGPS